jgi:hypothetical protein
MAGLGLFQKRNYYDDFLIFCGSKPVSLGNCRNWPCLYICNYPYLYNFDCFVGFMFIMGLEIIFIKYLPDVAYLYRVNFAVL